MTADGDSPRDTLVLLNATPVPVDRARLEPCLVVLAGHLIGEMLPITDGMVVGRGPGVALRIEDDGISKAHFKLTRRSPTEIELLDLDSTNGTHVNSQPVSRQVLADGDKIQLGVSTVLKLVLADSVDRLFQRQMQQAALRDALTGLYNRRHLEAQLNAEISFSNRHISPASLLLIDIDHFKRVNDTRGHLVGDAVLRAIADCIAGAIRKEDLAARYGGEEFAVVCRGTSSQMAMVVAQRIRTLVAGGAARCGYDDLRITVSAGVAQVPRDGIDTSPQWLGAADRALYRAKRGGRNQVCIFSAQLDGALAP